MEALTEKERRDAEKQRARKEMMLREPLPKVIMKMAVPCIVAFLITSIYNLADTYFVSSIGTNATAAVSVNQSLDNIIMMAGSFLAAGAASYIARLLGAKKDLKASQVLSTSFFLALILGLLVGILGTCFRHPLVRLLGATDTCEQYAVEYATYVLYAAPFMATSFVLNQCLRAEGSPLRSMIGMGFGGILNCFLDPVFIFTLNMGVAGASLATMISKIVSWCILMYPYVTHKSILHIGVSRFSPTRDILSEVASVGSSSAFRMALNILAAILLNRQAGAISDAVLAGIGVCTKIMMFPFGFVIGFGQGFQPVAGFNWGAKRFDRVRESYRFASLAAIAGSIVMAVVLGACAKPIISLFSPGGDEEMMRIGALAIRLQSLALPCHAWAAIVNMLSAGLGKGKWAVLIATSRQGTCFLPILFPLAILFGASGLASVQAVADILSLAIAIPVHFKAKKLVREAEEGRIETVV